MNNREIILEYTKCNDNELLSKLIPQCMMFIDKAMVTSIHNIIDGSSSSSSSNINDDNITDNVIDKPNRLLVHCYLGQSRSAFIICCYLIYKHHMNVQESLQLIRIVRPTAQPNSSLMRVLKCYYDTIAVSSI